MLKKFLHGLAFGAGFGIAFAAVVVAIWIFILPRVIETRFGESEVIANTPPILKPNDKYLGSFGAYSGGFSSNRSGVLAEGPGEIIGEALANNKAAVGLKLRLALNGKVMSQWGTVDSNGQYIIRVPYGEYRIDGFELDNHNVNSVLANKIDHPQNAHSSDEFVVSADATGRGLRLRFVDPVALNMKKKKFSVSEDVIIDWVPYPGASEYYVQVHEKMDPHGYDFGKSLFKWSERPIITGTSINLRERSAEVKKGHFYVVEIHAQKGGSNVLSQTPRRYEGFDFEIVE